MDKSDALNISLAALRNAVTEDGILASTVDSDNYKRIWSRDGVIGGIAGLICLDEVVIEGLENTLKTLLNHQHPLGIIPSNVRVTNKDVDYSLGSLAGRVDATTWFIIGACLLLKHNKDDQLAHQFQDALLKAIGVLEYWEYNAAGLLYTPLSGNWADEYPVRGHTLYDNLLRMWGISLYTDLFNDARLNQKLSLIKEKIRINFWPDKKEKNKGLIYNPRLYDEKADHNLSHWLCFLAPDRFDDAFDAAGNALALLLDVGNQEQKGKVVNYISSIFKELEHDLIPAFWPPITEDHPSWPLLAQNYSFRFKNSPYNFHNGGIWPVWMGLCSLGLAKIGESEIVNQILAAYLPIENSNNFKFSEYINSSNFECRGQQHLTFSAAGLVFMIQATRGVPEFFL